MPVETRECPYCWTMLAGERWRIELHISSCEIAAFDRADQIFVETDRLFHEYHMNRTEQEIAQWGGMSSQ